MSDYFMNYDNDYPDVVYEVLEYFNISNADKKLSEKSIIDFCLESKSTFKYQPNAILRICKRLMEAGVISCLKMQGNLGLQDSYIFNCNDDERFKRDRDIISLYYNCTVYGFNYIYNLYKDIVVPLVWEKSDGTYSAGTGFRFLNGIVTAKHCITDVKNLSIKGYSAEMLSGKPIYISDNDGVDIAFIETGVNDYPLSLHEDGDIMQEVLVMGYPKIPAFTGFLTAEKATISSKAAARITPTRGSIAAYGYEYLNKIDAMLITARIRGGNSGGPVINEHGCIVGITCHSPDVDPNNGDYDDLGYGVAIPVSYLLDIIDHKPNQIHVDTDFFRDFE